MERRVLRIDRNDRRARRLGELGDDSPPTTSDSLLASAKSMPSPSAAIVGTSPAEPTIAFSTRSAPLSVISRTSPSGRRIPVRRSTLPRPGRRIWIRERDPLDAVLARLFDQRFPGPFRGNRDYLQLLGAARDHIERLNADRARRAEDHQLASHRRDCSRR